MQTSHKNSLPDIPLFKEWTEQNLSKLKESARLQPQNKGKTLFLQNDPATHFYVIKSGWIKLFRETLDGTQAVIDVLPAGHVFGETAIFSDNIHTNGAEAIENSQIIAFPLSHLKAELQDNPALALFMMKSMTNRIHRQDKEIEHRGIQNASQRIGCFLLRLTDQNQSQNAKMAIIHLPYDKMLLAARLGMQPETFSRALTKLSEKTNLNIQGATIQINNIDKLVHYACTACSSEFPCKDLQKQRA